MSRELGELQACKMVAMAGRQDARASRNKRRCPVVSSEKKFIRWCFFATLPTCLPPVPPTVVQQNTTSPASEPSVLTARDPNRGGIQAA
jgi:hypothetical protein